MRRRVLWPSWVLVSSVALLFAAGLEVPGWVEYAPFALSLVLFGLPHGAVDHLAVPRLLGRKPWPWPAAAVGLLYLVLGSLYLALWALHPVSAFALFIALTWFHWGGGDLHALVAFAPGGGSYPPGGKHRAFVLLARGGLPMLVPLLAHPEIYRAVAESTVRLLSEGAPGPSWPFEPAFRFYAGATFALLVAGNLAYGYRHAKGRGALAAWRVDAAETALLVAYFVLVPPVLAVGLYFCVWHDAPRHIARLVLLDEASAVSLEGGRFPLAPFVRDAAPLTLVALALLLGLYLALPGPRRPLCSRCTSCSSPSSRCRTSPSSRLWTTSRASGAETPYPWVAAPRSPRVSAFGPLGRRGAERCRSPVAFAQRSGGPRCNSDGGSGSCGIEARS